MCQFVLAARYWIIYFTHTIEIGLRHWWLWTKNCFVLFKRRPARTLAVRFTDVEKTKLRERPSKGHSVGLSTWFVYSLPSLPGQQFSFKTLVTRHPLQFPFRSCAFARGMKLTCITGALWVKRGERGILREAPDECDARDEGKRKLNHVHYMNVAFQLVNWWRVVLACLSGTK